MDDPKTMDEAAAQIALGATAAEIIAALQARLDSCRQTRTYAQAEATRQTLALRELQTQVTELNERLAEKDRLLNDRHRRLNDAGREILAAFEEGFGVSKRSAMRCLGAQRSQAGQRGQIPSNHPMKGAR